MLRQLIFSAFLVMIVSCGGDEALNSEACEAQDIPLVGPGPTLTNANMECDGENIIVELTLVAEPPADVTDVVQTVGIYPSQDCTGVPLVTMDDAISGLAETFGDYPVTRTDNQRLYDEICGSAVWPMSVVLGDTDGNQTSANVLANING